MNTVNLYQISGNIFKKINYFDINDLIEKLNELLEEYNNELIMQLILNNIIINEGNDNNNFNFYKINNLKELNADDIIQVIFIEKKLLFICIDNNGKYFLNNKYKNDNYFKLLKHYYITSDTYDNILKLTYKDIILKSIKIYPRMLQYASIAMKNDYDIILSSINKYSVGFYYATDNIKNDVEFISQAIIQNIDILEYVNHNIVNNKENVLILVKYNGLALKYASTELQKDKDIVLIAIKQNHLALKYVNIELKKDKDILLIIKNL